MVEAIKEPLQAPLQAPRILAINTGSSSTKIAIYDGDREKFSVNLEHSSQDLHPFPTISAQHAFRKKMILDALKQQKIDLATINAVVGRGGLIYPVEGGTYRINSLMVEHLSNGVQGQHASNLSGIIAYEVAKNLGIAAYTVDPVVVNELQPIAMVTGLKELKRKCIFHALNLKAVGRKVAKEIGKDYTAINLVLVHLGTGISIGVSQNGRIIDVTNPFSSGPFSPERCGGLPSEELMELCYSGTYTHQEMIDKIYKEGGLFSFFKTRDIRVVEQMEKDRDDEAKLVLDAMAYQIGKGIGEMAAAVGGKVERIVITGGIAKSISFVSRITPYVEWIAPIVIVPGEEEMPALVAGTLRVLCHEEQEKNYLPDVLV